MEHTPLDVRTLLPNTLTDQYKKIFKYMVSNKLFINDDKTNLGLMTKKSMEVSRQQVVLQAGEHNIHPLKTVKLLGCHISLAELLADHYEQGCQCCD